MTASERFVCKFAAGRNGQRVSASWRLFSGKKKPDLYLGVEGALSQIKATVHCPRPGVGWTTPHEVQSRGAW